MKITIDTKEDSKEDIKKAISFLQKFTDEEIYPESKPEMFGMFDSEEPNEKNQEEKTDSGEKKPEDFSISSLIEEY